MAKAPTAIELLNEGPPQKGPPVCALFGDDAFLKREVLRRLRDAILSGDEAEFSQASFDGRQAEWPEVIDELTTVAMFGGGQRLVVIDTADDFVTANRQRLEDYVAKPKATGVLILDLASFPSNTRLYKAVASAGLLVDCAAPSTSSLPRWLTAWAKQAHRVELPLAAAETLVELIGPETGLIDQEIGRLALTAVDGRITAEQVARSVGTWRTRTTWDMLDAALDGKASEALAQLDRLLTSGEVPIGLLAQIGATLRRLAAATRLVLQAEAAGRRPVLRDALTGAGIKPFVLQKAERQLRTLGRARGAKLYDWLLEADLDLKGDSPLPPRLILERLILRLSARAS